MSDPSTPAIQPYLTAKPPLLISLLDPPGRFVLMPFYFGALEVSGREHFPCQGPVVVAVTHRSRWDALVVPYAIGYPITGRTLRFMVSADEMEGLQGWFIRNCGGFPVDTSRPSITSLRHGIELLQQGEVLVIFPEGNIMRERQVQRLKPGLARMALQAQQSLVDQAVQIVPMVIEYSQLIPRWRCQVQVKIGIPLNVANYKARSRKTAAAKLTSDLKVALEQLSTKTIATCEANQLSLSPSVTLAAKLSQELNPMESPQHSTSGAPELR